MTFFLLFFLKGVTENFGRLLFYDVVAEMILKDCVWSENEHKKTK